MRKFTILFLICVLFFSIASQAQSVWYVNNAASGNNNGTTPQDAFRSLDNAINAATDNDTIKVAVGTYKPSQMLSGGASDRDNTFYITKGFVLLGGYNTNFNGRDIYVNTTILDGDIGTTGNMSDNCHHVLVWDNAAISGIIDGFTIQNGNADVATTVSGIARNHGGAIFINRVSNLVISNTTFRNNTVIGNGGAVYNAASPVGAMTISQSLFVQNTAALGGAVYSSTGGTTGFNKIINSTFSKNSAIGGSGGAVYFSNTTASSSKIAYCTFNGNTASNSVGNAIYYPSAAAKELKGNIIYGNGSGTEINTLPPSSDYNLIRNQALSGTGNINVLDGNTDNIFQEVGADGTAILGYYGGANMGLMPVRLGFAHNKIPGASASSIDPTTTDQRDSTRVFDGAAEIGAVEINWKWAQCVGNTTWYVDGISGATLSSGESIFEPINDLAMVLANPCLKVGDTVRVVGSEQGEGLIYRPTLVLGTSPAGLTNRDRTFYIDSSITLLGGYSSGFFIRDPNLYKTVLDGDWGVLGNNTDNSYHVLVWNTTDGQEGAINGFTIQNGNANVNTVNVVNRYAGGGIYQQSGKLNVANTIIQNNLSGSNGGGIYQNAPLSITSNIFKENKATTQGGAVYANAALNIDHTSFLSNTATTNGGAIYRSTLTGTVNITKSTFSNNSAALGGAFYSDVNNAANLNYISNSTFSGNKASAANGGGAIYFSTNAASTSKITYSTFNANTATSNVGNAIRYANASQDLLGNIIYGNGVGNNTEIATIPSKANAVKYNIIRDQAVTGTGNVSNQNIPVGKALYIFANVVGDSAILADNGGQTQTLMLLQGSFAQNKIPAASAIDTVTTDQRDEPRNTANFSIGSVELPLDCNPAKIWYVDINAPAGGTGLSAANPINDLSLLLANSCLKTNDTVKVTKGNYKPTTIPFENSADTRDRNFLVPVSIHLWGGYNADFSEATRDTTGLNTFLDGDLGTLGNATDNAYHVLVWNAADGQTGTINGFTIQNGNGNVATTINGIIRNRGAGINLNLGSLNIINTTVQNNTTLLTTSYGGGIYTATGTTLNLTNSIVSNNTTASNGGGIYAEQMLILNNTSILGNKSSVASGAGVYAKDALQLIGKVVLDSNATATGGGIYKNTVGALTADRLDTLIITNNTATSSGSGFYIGVAMDAPNLKYVKVANNITPTSGAGIYANSSLALLGADSIIIRDNIAGNTGGGIYAANALSLNANNILIVNNKAGYSTITGLFSGATNHGGGISANNALILSGKVQVIDNKASGNGGGIYKNTTGSLDVSGVDALILIGNETRSTATNSSGGGFYAGMAADFINLKYTNISNNTAVFHGGGIYAANILNMSNADSIILQNNKAGYNALTGVYSSTAYHGGGINAANNLILSGSMNISDNTTTGHGGAIYAAGTADLLNGNWITFQNNKAGYNGSTFLGTYHGGGIYATNTLTLSGKIAFKNNIASYSGGGIYKYGAANAGGTFITTLLDSLIAENNQAVNGQGGAIYTYVTADILSPRGWFIGNSAKSDGGAIYANSAFSISDYNLSNNSSKRYGGAIFCNNTFNLLGFVRFENNTADTLGGAIYIGSTISVASVDSIIMNNNSAGFSGGGIYTKGDIQFYGLIKGSFRNNKALTQHGGAIYGEKALYIQNAVFTQNKATINGGAIYNIGLTDVKTSTFNSNRADTAGAIYKGITGVLNVSLSTFSGNAATANGGAVASYYGINVATAASQQTFINNTFSGNRALGKGGAIYFGYTGGTNNTFTARATVAFCSFNSNSSNSNSNAIHYEKTAVAANSLGTLFGNIICNGPSGFEINDATNLTAASTQYNIVRGLTLPGTNNQNVLNTDIGNIFENVIGDSVVLANNEGSTYTLLIKETGGLAYNKIPRTAAMQYATNDQRNKNRIVDSVDIGSVELDEDPCSIDPSPVVWYVDISVSVGGDGTSIANTAKNLETVLNNLCLKDRDTVKIAQGTYFSTNTDPTQSFFVTKAIVIKGGYPTGDFTEANRNIVANPTILDGKSTSYHTIVWNSDDAYASIIDGVTLQKGKAIGAIISGTIPQNKGGGLFLCLGDLLVSNTTIQDNMASSAGGGIYSSENAILTLQNIQSFRNRAGYNGSSFITGADGTDLVKQIEKSGGGVCVLGSFSMRGNLLFQNDEAGVNGGGVFKGTFNNTDASLLDTLTMTACIARVTATGASSQGHHGGGGIYTMCALDLTAAKKLLFTNCQAPTGSMGEGGGIFINNKTGRLISLRVANGKFVNCTCGDDGGALESFGGTVSLIYAKDCYFKSCTAVRYGGAIGSGHALELAGKIEMDSCIAGKNGGGISQWISGGTKLPIMFNATLLDTLIITRSGVSTIATTTSTDGGGGIWVGGNNLDLNNLKYLYVANCYSNVHGGGILLSNYNGSGKLILPSNAYFINNKAGSKDGVNLNGIASALGGAIYNVGGDVEIKGKIQLDSNTASLHGGGIWVASTYSILATSLDTLLMRGNKALAGSGGGLYSLNKALDFSNLKYGVISNNYAKVDGGAIYAGEMFYIINANFLNNKADNNGGAIWKSATGKITIRKSTLAYNEALSGGAVYNSIVTGADNSLFVNSTFSQNKATAGNGGALYMACNAPTLSTSQILLCTFNGNTATSEGSAIYYVNPSGETVRASIIYGNGTTDINNTAALVANYNVFKQSILGNGNIQVGNNNAGSIFRTVGSGETATLENNGGRSQTLALKIGGYAHNLAPADSINKWFSGQIGNYTDERDSARSVGCKVDGGAYEIQASEYDLSSYVLKQNISLCGDILIDADTLVLNTINMKDTLYFSDRNYTQVLPMPTHGHERIYVKFLSNTNCEFYDSIQIQFGSIIPVADIPEASRNVCSGSTVQITARVQQGVNYTWSNYADFSDTHSGENTNILTFKAKSLNKDTSFYIYVTASTGCGFSQDSILITIKGIQNVDISVPNNIISDACVAKPFEFTIKTKNTIYYTFQPSNLNIGGTDQTGALVGTSNQYVNYDSATFNFHYTPAAADKGKNLTIIFRSTGDAACGYRQDTLKFLILPEPTAAKMELISQPLGLQEICKDTVYTLKIKATNIGGLINNKISLVDLGASGIIVDSAKYLYPVTVSPLESAWKSLGTKDSINDLFERANRYEYDSVPNLNGNDSVFIRFYVHAGCGFKSNNAMKFKASVFDKCGTAVGIADQTTNPFRLESGVSNTYTFDDSFIPAILNPKIKDSVQLRVKVIITGTYETDSTTESIIADYPPYFIPDLSTFQHIWNANGQITTTPVAGGDIRHSITIPSGLKAKNGGGQFTDSVIFAVRCYTGNVPCGELDLRNQVFYEYTTNACGEECKVTEVRAQSIDVINVLRYAFELTDDIKGSSQLGKWGDTIEVRSITPFLANDSIKVQFFVDKDGNSKRSAADSLVYSGYIYSGSGVAASSLFNVPFVNIPYKSGYQLIAYSEDVKMCDTMTIPINVISGPDTVCQGRGKSGIFEAPAGMLNYTFDAISGATTIPDNTLAPNQIKKGFTTAGDMSIRGTYRRVIYNEETGANDTVQAAYSTFKFYVNPSITADSITVVGDSTNICTPAVVKLYAKNLQHAAAHQWIASTQAGSLSNETTDTLTYTLYPRTNDTTIFVYYTATGLSTCSDWKDTIQLNLYQTLTQPDPAFLDSTICKGSNLQINMGLPSGGGTTDYTYQWQDSTRIGGWQNATASYPGYTATSQNYIPTALNDTTWFRRIVVGKCDSDTGKVIIVNARKTIATVSILDSDSISMCSGSSKSINVQSDNAEDIIWTYIDYAGNRQELQYPNYTIPDIGSTLISVDKKEMTLASIQQLNDVIFTFEVTGKDKCGDIKDTIKVNLRGFPTGKIVKLQDTTICYDQNFNFANVVTNTTYLGFETTGTGTLGVMNNTSVVYLRDSITNYYRPASTEANSVVKLRMKYRNDVCDYQSDSINIFVLPKITQYKAELVTQPEGLQEVCTDTVYEVKIKAIDPGNLENVKFTFDNIDSLKIKHFAYKYPYNALDWSYIADSTVSNGKTTWLIPDSIRGVDSLLVHITFSPVCGFQSGRPLFFSINLTDACNHPMPDTTLITNSFRTVQDTLMKGGFQVLTSFNGVPLNTTGSIILNSHTNDTVTWRLAAVPAVGTIIDTNRQFIQVTLPLVLPTVLGSYIPVKNAPAYTALKTRTEGTNLVLQLPVVPQMAGDTCIAEFKFVAGKAPCGLYSSLAAEVIYRDSVKCGNDTCAFFATFGSAKPTVDVQRYVFALDTIKGVTRAGFWNADINLKTPNGFFASDSVKVDFYVDVNNNNVYDAGDGSPVATRYLKSSTDILSGGILKVNFANIPVTYGKQLIAYSKDSLLCTITQFPITILSSNDEICTSDTTLLVFPQGMTDYHTDAVSGATAVPLLGSSSSNYPNENIRQIRWTAPRTTDTVIFMGSYRRTLPGGSTMLSEKAIFIAKIYNAITYDSLSMMGRSKEICSPDTIKIQAKNVKYATTRQWTASAEVGTLINANTDTLTYAIYPRLTNDTTVWVVYHATAAGVCKDIRDSVQLTIYQTLTQPAPGFLDTTICKNANVNINIGDPSGGGFHNLAEYSFQWQDSTKGNSWKNIIAGGLTVDYSTPSLPDTTWYRRIVTAKCDKDTSAVVRVAVYPQLVVDTIIADYPHCMGDSIRLSFHIKGGKQPYMYSFDGINYNKLTSIDSVTTLGYTVAHIDTLLHAGAYTINVLDSSLCLLVNKVMNIKPNSPSAEPKADILYVKTTPSGNADGSDWDNAFDGKYLAWYLKNKATTNTRIYVAEGTYIPYLDSCDDAGTKRTYSFEFNKDMQIKGGFAASAAGTDTISTYDPKNNVTRLSGEIQKDADATNNSYHVVNVAHSVNLWLDGFYISDGYAYDVAGDNNVPFGPNGGGIYDNGGTSLTHVTYSSLIIENNAAKYGGGAYINKNQYSRMQDVIIRNNTNLEINYGGAGIFAWGNFILNNTTISNNKNGSGITSWGGDMLLRNSTISGNEKYGIEVDNGSFGNWIRIGLVNTTVTGNSNTGVVLKNYRLDSLTFSFDNTLITGNATNIQFGGTFPIDTVMLKYTIIGLLKYETDKSNSHSIPIPVALAPLADNGGWGETHALLDPCENPAVQAGDVSLLSHDTLKYDQRRVLRKNPPSIGAYDNDETILIAFNKQAIDTVCGNTSYQIASTVTVPFGMNIVGYQWYKNGVALTDSTKQTITFDSIKVGDAGKYTLLVTTDNINCSRMSDTVNVFVHQAPLATISNDADICIGEDITVTFTLTAGEKFPQWELRYKIDNNEQPKLTNNSNTNTIQITISPLQTATYSLIEVKDGNGCSTFY